MHASEGRSVAWRASGVIPELIHGGACRVDARSPGSSVAPFEKEQQQPAAASACACCVFVSFLCVGGAPVT
ncbi:unnamed protein product [Amoebophrya sp. A120]|nr:unnamed protein product [Amoebophrya sp. A120]|eukprot:GSA120T00018182001.1